MISSAIGNNKVVEIKSPANWNFVGGKPIVQDGLRACAPANNPPTTKPAPTPSFVGFMSGGNTSTVLTPPINYYPKLLLFLRGLACLSLQSHMV